MNTVMLLILLLLACLCAVSGVTIVALRRERARLRRDKEEAEAARSDLRQKLSATETLLAETRQGRDTAEHELHDLREAHLRTRTELAALQASTDSEIASLRAKNAEEREAERAAREKLEERFRLEFKNLATEILGEQSRAFKQTNKESLDLLEEPRAVLFCRDGREVSTGASTEDAALRLLRMGFREALVIDTAELTAEIVSRTRGR